MAPSENLNDWLSPPALDRRDRDRRAHKLNEPVTMKLFITVLSGVIVAGLLWLSSMASSSVVTTSRFERDSARRDYRDSMQTRDMQDMRADVRCIRAVVKKSPTVDEVCR